MLEHLNKDTFKEKVFDFEKHQIWKYEGKLPALIDFYADWCGPCKTIAPILEELQSEFEGKIKIFKINTESEQELAAIFNIQNIPSLLFIPLNESPQMATGALPKDSFVRAFKEVLDVE